MAKKNNDNSVINEKTINDNKHKVSKVYPNQNLKDAKREYIDNLKEKNVKQKESFDNNNSINKEKIKKVDAYDSVREKVNSIMEDNKKGNNISNEKIDDLISEVKKIKHESDLFYSSNGYTMDTVKSMGNYIESENFETKTKNSFDSIMKETKEIQKLNRNVYEANEEHYKTIIENLNDVKRDNEKSSTFDKTVFDDVLYRINEVEEKSNLFENSYSSGMDLISKNLDDLKGSNSFLDNTEKSSMESINRILSESHSYTDVRLDFSEEKIGVDLGNDYVKSRIEQAQFTHFGELREELSSIKTDIQNSKPVQPNRINHILEELKSVEFNNKDVQQVNNIHLSSLDKISGNINRSNLNDDLKKTLDSFDKKTSDLQTLNKNVYEANKNFYEDITSELRGLKSDCKLGNAKIEQIDSIMEGFNAIQNNTDIYKSKVEGQIKSLMDDANILNQNGKNSEYLNTRAFNNLQRTISNMEYNTQQAGFSVQALMLQKRGKDVLKYNSILNKIEQLQSSTLISKSSGSDILKEDLINSINKELKEINIGTSLLDRKFNSLRCDFLNYKNIQHVSTSRDLYLNQMVETLQQLRNRDQKITKSLSELYRSDSLNKVLNLPIKDIVTSTNTYNKKTYKITQNSRGRKKESDVSYGGKRRKAGLTNKKMLKQNPLSKLVDIGQVVKMGAIRFVYSRTVQNTDMDLGIDFAMDFLSVTACPILDIMRVSGSKSLRKQLIFDIDKIMPLLRAKSIIPMSLKSPLNGGDVKDVVNYITIYLRKMGIVDAKINFNLSHTKRPVSLRTCLLLKKALRKFGKDEEIKQFILVLLKANSESNLRGILRFRILKLLNKKLMSHGRDDFTIQALGSVMMLSRRALMIYNTAKSFAFKMFMIANNLGKKAYKRFLKKNITKLKNNFKATHKKTTKFFKNAKINLNKAKNEINAIKAAQSKRFGVPKVIKDQFKKLGSFAANKIRKIPGAKKVEKGIKAVGKFIGKIFGGFGKVMSGFSFIFKVVGAVLSVVALVMAIMLLTVLMVAATFDLSNQNESILEACAQQIKLCHDNNELGMQIYYDQYKSVNRKFVNEKDVELYTDPSNQPREPIIESTNVAEILCMTLVRFDFQFNKRNKQEILAYVRGLYNGSHVTSLISHETVQTDKDGNEYTVKTADIIVTTKYFNSIFNSQIMSISQGIIVPGEIEKQVWFYLTSAGVPPIQTAGIMGNIYGESGFNPGASEVGGTGYGICQWSDTKDSHRRTELFNYAASKGESVPSLETQLEFLMMELKPGNFNSYYTGVNNYNYWINATNTYDATYYFMWGWERPAGWAGESSLTKRTTAAENYYQTYKDMDMPSEEEDSDSKPNNGGHTNPGDVPDSTNKPDSNNKPNNGGHTNPGDIPDSTNKPDSNNKPNNGGHTNPGDIGL